MKNLMSGMYLIYEYEDNEEKNRHIDEMLGKSFYAKLNTDGTVTYKKTIEVKQ